ncbi:MAG: hypothetical protein OXC46_09005 [Thaumarchaeota archaeon]|nr:hypothetical protein [Nitrososphaerota archaeon]
MLHKAKSYNLNSDVALMVEQLISKEHEFGSRDKLWQTLPQNIPHQMFERIFEHLEDSNKIMINKEGIVMWIFTDNQKLEKLHHVSKKLR